MESRLAGADIFARRWATHEGLDFSRKRFDEFGLVLLNAFPGVDSLRLIPKDLSQGWTIPHGVSSTLLLHTPGHRALLNTARRHRRTVLSSPIRSPHAKKRSFLAVLPLRRGETFLGWLIVEFHVGPLIDSCFLEHIRSEFSFVIHDGAVVLYRYRRGDSTNELGRTLSTSHTFRLRNRRWRLTMAPLNARVASYRWHANLYVPLFGLLLSLGVSLLFYLLSRRIELYRSARDLAEIELAERRRAEKALRFSESRYRSVFDSATDGLLILRPDGTIIEANPAACTLHGYEPGRLEGTQIQALVAPSSQEHYRTFLQQIQRTGSVELDSVNLRRDGEPVEVQVRGTGFQYDNEPRVLAILTDVTERRRVEKRQRLLARQALQAQEEERARVSRDLHDELGQIITALRLEIDLLRRSPPPTSATSPTTFSIATDLVDKAAAELRRICRGLRPPLLDDLGIEPAVHQLVETFEQHTGKQVQIEVALADPEPGLTIDVALCTYRILQEALTNIARHSDAQTVSISLVRDGDDLLLSVYDDGQGFELDLSDGRGFGLAGMHERSHLIGATLMIRSIPREGTRIELRAPLVKPD